MENDTPCNWNILNAMEATRDAWKAVTSTTISNCWRHAGITVPEAPLPEEDDQEEKVMEGDDSYNMTFERSTLFSQMLTAVLKLDEEIRDVHFLIDEFYHSVSITCRITLNY